MCISSLCDNLYSNFIRLGHDFSLISQIPAESLEHFSWTFRYQFGTSPKLFKVQTFCSLQERHQFLEFFLKILKVCSFLRTIIFSSSWIFSPMLMFFYGAIRLTFLITSSTCWHSFRLQRYFLLSWSFFNYAGDLSSCQLQEPFLKISFVLSSTL